MSESSAQLEYELMLLCRQLMDVQRRVKAGDVQLDRSAYVLLSRLEREGALSIKQLRERLGLDDSTLNRQTAAMLRSGLVQRIVDPNGGAARKFEVTDEGRAQLADARAAAASHYDTATAQWSPDQRARLLQALREFNMALEAQEGRAWPRD